MVNSWSSDCIIYLACVFINVVHVCQVGLGCHKCELSSDVIYDYKLHRFYRCEFDRMFSVSLNVSLDPGLVCDEIILISWIIFFLRGRDRGSQLSIANHFEGERPNTPLTTFLQVVHTLIDFSKRKREVNT